MRSGATRSNQSTNPSWSSARVRLSRPWYAASRIRMWGNRTPVLRRNARVVRPDQLLARQARQARFDTGLERRDEQVLHRALVEGLSDHGGAFDHGPFRLAEPIQPGTEQRRDRRRHRDLAEVGRRSAHPPRLDEGGPGRSASPASARRTADCPRPRGRFWLHDASRSAGSPASSPLPERLSLLESGLERHGRDVRGPSPTLDVPPAGPAGPNKPARVARRADSTTVLA